MDDLVVDNMPLAKKLASRMFFKINFQIDLEDLTSVAYLGLIHAVRTYDPNKGAQLNTWITTKVTGYLIDYLRQEDPLTRTQRKLDRGLCATVQFGDEDDEEHGCKLSTVASPYATPDEVFAKNELVKILNSYQTRKPVYREIMLGYFLEEKSMRELASANHMVESRISQIVKREAEKIRKHIDRCPFIRQRTQRNNLCQSL
jgi:RNA polymerase sigma factor (sigma-70 family)